MEEAKADRKVDSERESRLASRVQALGISTGINLDNIRAVFNHLDVLKCGKIKREGLYSLIKCTRMALSSDSSTISKGRELARIDIALLLNILSIGDPDLFSE